MDAWKIFSFSFGSLNGLFSGGKLAGFVSGSKGYQLGGNQAPRDLPKNQWTLVSRFVLRGLVSGSFPDFAGLRRWDLRLRKQ